MRGTRPIRIFPAAAALACAAVAFAGDAPPAGGTVKVIAEGVAGSPDKALKDALRNAVQQVVGAVVDSEVQIKNDEVIAEQVLTYSDGFVRSYKQLSEKKVDGLYRVKIAADVERRSVIAKLRAAKVAVKKLDGQGLFAEAVSGLEAEKGARDVLAAALKDAPEGLVVAAVVGKPEVLEKDAARAKVRLRVAVSVDAKAYRAFAARLEKTLDGIAREKGEFEFVATSKTQFDGVYRTSEGNLNRLWTRSFPGAFKGRGRFNAPALTAVALATQLSKLKDRSEWRSYVLDASCRDVLWRHAYRPGQVKLVLADEDGRAVATDRFDLGHLGPIPGYSVHFAANPVTPAGLSTLGDLTTLGTAADAQAAANAFLYIISPMFWQRATFEAQYMPAVELRRDVTLALDELKAVQSVRCELHYQPAGAAPSAAPSAAPKPAP